MKAYYVKQGDEFSIPLTISADGTALNNTTAELVEVMIGHEIRKTWPGDVTWDGDDKNWLVPLTQAETFAMVPGTEIPLDVRVKLTAGEVLGTIEAIRLRIAAAQSKTVLS